MFRFLVHRVEQWYFVKLHNLERTTHSCVQPEEENALHRPFTHLT